MALSEQKKEIIKFLDKDIGLFIVSSDEDSQGNEYITEIRFKEIERVMRALEAHRAHAEAWEQKIKDIYEGSDRFTVFSGQISITDATLNLPEPMILMGGQSHISNVTINTRGI